MPPTTSDLTRLHNLSRDHSGPSPNNHRDPITQPLSRAEQTGRHTLYQTKLRREQWARDNLPSHVQLLLDEPFGKDNTTQCFTSDVCFRHSLPFIMQSGLLEEPDLDNLMTASTHARRLDKLIRDHADVDFRPLREPSHNWQDETSIETPRIRMVTACIIHYDFYIPSVIRFIGGTHVGAHRDTSRILDELQGKVPDPILHNLARLYRHGAPNFCNAHSTEANYQAFRAYGNHKSATKRPDITMQAFVKDHKKRFLIAALAGAFPYIPHSHLTPVAVANVDHEYKKARFVFDSSFRPEPWCNAINDWTSKDTEPPLHFASSFYDNLVWIWNLRISYPREDIYPGDDDVAGAFRHGKYHPNLVAMHCIVIFGLVLLMTGMTFGDNTSPSNWEPIALARMHYARWLWTQPDTLQRAAPFTPAFTVAPPPTTAERASFVQATPDSKNKGVYNSDGTRKPPPYRHHVDDNMYAEIRKYLALTLAATVLSLYVVLGFPRPHLQDPLSWEKLQMHFTHQRTQVGRAIDTRRMTVGLTTAKRELLVSTLRTWDQKTHFTLLEGAQLYGLLSDSARICRWAWPRFFAIRNALSYEIRQRSYAARRVQERRGTRHRLAARLSRTQLDRLDGLIHRDLAEIVWQNNFTIRVNPQVRRELTYLREYLANPANPWEISIGHIVARDPFGTSAGDASHDGAGAVNYQMRFFIDCAFGHHLRQRLKIRRPSHPDYIHINAAEFVILILQVAAIIARVEASPPGTYPHLMVFQLLTDNTPSKGWLSKLSCSSRRGQLLLEILSELLRRSDLGFNCDHIRGADNTIPDHISRISPKLPLASRRQQILQKAPELRSWDCFLPNPAFLSLLVSKLSSDAKMDVPKLPKHLGRFAPVSSTTTCSFTICTCNTHTTAPKTCCSNTSPSNDASTN